MPQAVFNPTDYGIPQDKLDYMLKMLKDYEVTLAIEDVSFNPDIKITDLQQCEDIKVARMNTRNDSQIPPRCITLDMYRHKVLIFTSHNTTLKIFFSLIKNVYDNNETVVPNKQIELEDKMPRDFSGIYIFSLYLRDTMTHWLCIMADDIYKWAESYGCVDLLYDDDSYLYASFDHLKKNAKIFIEMFGHDTIESAIEDLSTCGCCGNEYKD